MFKKQKAFTMIELLVTLSIFGVLAALAVPSFQRQIANNRSLALADEFTGALNYARSEALKRGKSVTLCPANTTGNNCGTDWLDGWLVIVDTAVAEVTKPPVIANEDAILKRWEKLDSSSVITVSPAGRQFVRFTGTGTMAKTDAGPAVITAQVGKCTGDAARRIRIGVTGMLNTEHSTCL